MVEVAEWAHLSGTIAIGLESVRTPYVLVLQHDFYFARDVPIDWIVQLLQEQPNVRQVRFNKRPNIPLGDDAHSTNGVNFFSEVRYQGFEDLTLCRAPSWSDTPHLCTMHEYREVVEPRYNLYQGYAEKMIRQESVVEEHGYWGTYVFGEFGSPATVQFLDGQNDVYGFQHFCRWLAPTWHRMANQFRWERGSFSDDWS